MKADLKWGEDYPAFFLTAEDEGDLFDDVSPVDIPPVLIARLRAARAEEYAAVQAIRGHCEQTGQRFPDRPA